MCYGNRQSSRTFVAGNVRCKWKSGKKGVQSIFHKIEQPPIRAAINTSSQVWTCYETTAPSTHSPATGHGSSSSAASAPVAVFFPPQVGLVKSELTVYPSGGAITDHIILTAILICARKDEWRTAQSTITRNTLEATLKAEMRGTLPPYIPDTAERYHVPSPRPLRRPHSTSATRARYATPPDPPPYTSLDDNSGYLRRHR
ncbi:hypothetical protein K439DRAFT_1638456 [Ramaria rubella]|nr:hypothetical protein K439DRAFT_1638456 [Ramaria rubella]